MPAPYDAVILVSFGGPEGPDDVLPFLRNVTRGRAIPEDRLARVAEHYQHFGGVSPINEHCRALLAALRPVLDEAAVTLPLYWGNRNWTPLLAQTLARMRDDGIRRALAFVTSPYGSYSSCRQYLEEIAAAREVVGPDAPAVDKIRHFHDHPGYVEPHAEGVRRALAELASDRELSAGPDASDRKLSAGPDASDRKLSAGPDASDRKLSAGPDASDRKLSAGPDASDRKLSEVDDVRLVFTAHSVPSSMEESSGPDGGRYSAQLRETAALVAAAAGRSEWDLVWQSRSGPPHVSWLAPDINDHLAVLAADGVPGVVVSPIGFISDHLEVVWDLDTEAAATAKGLGLRYARAATPGTDPRFVAMVRDLIVERLDPGAPRARLGTLPVWDTCPQRCCQPAAR